MKLTFIIALLTASSSIFAQRFTYIGGGFGLISARFQNNESLWLTLSNSFIDGGSYDAFIRQEIVNFLSIEIGYSWRNYDFEYQIDDNLTATSSMGFWAHQIPVNIDVEVDVYKDFISAYATVGYLFCVIQGEGNSKQYETQNGGSLTVGWNNISSPGPSSQFTIGVGARFRLVDEFYVDTEIGNAFAVKDLREFKITYEDQSGNIKVYANPFQGNYWYFKIRISYPIQRIFQGVKKGIEVISVSTH